MLGKNGGGGILVGDLVERTVAAAKAMIEAGSDGFGMYADEHVMSEDVFWEALRQIRTGEF